MLIDGKDQTYFIDRDNCVFQVDNITFLHRKMPNKHIANTLLDGVSLGVQLSAVTSTKFGSVRVRSLSSLLERQTCHLLSVAVSLRFVTISK